jgi:hypothetical protein
VHTPILAPLVSNSTTSKGAVEALMPVFDVPPEQRISVLTGAWRQFNTD